GARQRDGAAPGRKVDHHAVAVIVVLLVAALVFCEVFDGRGAERAPRPTPSAPSRAGAAGAERHDPMVIVGRVRALRGHGDSWRLGAHSLYRRVAVRVQAKPRKASSQHRFATLAVPARRSLPRHVASWAGCKKLRLRQPRGPCLKRRFSVKFTGNLRG